MQNFVLVCGAIVSIPSFVLKIDDHLFNGSDVTCKVNMNRMIYEVCSLSLQERFDPEYHASMMENIDERFRRSYADLTSKIAYRYPNPGLPRYA